MEGDIGYDAGEYAASKQLPFRTDVEWFTIVSNADFSGARVLDAGCGDGIYSRKMIDLGARHVIGVDGDRGFIEKARRENSGYEGRIEYHQALIQDFIGFGDRDIAVGSYIFSYPRNLDEAILYARAINSHLIDGGKFVGFNNNPFEIFEGRRYADYGYEKEMREGEEGAKVLWRVTGVRDPIVNYFLKPETYEKAFMEAGFSQFVWKRVSLDPRSSQEVSYWQEFFEDEPPFIGMLAVK